MKSEKPNRLETDKYTKDDNSRLTPHASRLIAVIPTYNEEKTIADTIKALKSLPRVVEVFVADDCSIDETVQKAKAAGSKVIIHSNNLGKGGSLNKVLAEVDLNSFDGIILADGDLGSSASEFEHLIKAFEKDSSQMVVAAFGPPSRKGGFGLVKGLARWAIKKYGGSEQTRAPLSGQRLIPIKMLKVILPFAEGFGMEVDMSIKALKNGYKVREVETKMSHDETGRDLAGFKHRGRQFIDVLKVAVKN